MTSHLNEIRSRWNDVLDLVEKSDRVAWLAFFDARLAAFDGEVLTLDFSDSRKFGSAHEYSESRERHKKILIDAIRLVTQLDVKILEI